MNSERERIARVGLSIYNWETYPKVLTSDIYMSWIWINSGHPSPVPEEESNFHTTIA
jgi:hypothetical protein